MCNALAAEPLERTYCAATLHAPDARQPQFGLWLRSRSPGGGALRPRHRVHRGGTGECDEEVGALPKDDQERKRAIREEMQRRFPALATTLATADALALISTTTTG